MKYLLITVFLFTVGAALSQENRFYQDFEELTDTKPISENLWQACKKPVNISWGSTDIRYSKTNVPNLSHPTRKWKGLAWRGEKINAQAVIWTTANCPDVALNVSNLTAANGKQIPASAVKAAFVRYVMTDELNKDGKGGCGYRPDHTKFDSSLVADMIDIKQKHDLIACTTQPVWVSVEIPQTAQPGVYRGQIVPQSPLYKFEPLDIEIRVFNRTLPAPQDRKFHLDLWQHPFAIARYHDLPLWSEAHFEAMRPVIKRLADAGQKVITATLIHAPWGGQTYDKFESMVMRIKKPDGSWAFDYAVFDKWIEFMMGMGINQQINCYSLIPWKLSFQYFDQASNRLMYLDTKVGTPEFNNYWQDFLTDFAKHLKQKGWFDITTIAMDERPLKSMQEVVRLIHEADPAYKISLAGNYHQALETVLYDYCVASGQFFPDSVLNARKAAGQKSTFYTCCSEPYPNTFSFSPPAESAWMAWYAAAKGFDGYLRWAFNSWTENPLQDTRFDAWPAGDCYLIYPCGRSSIRFERLNEGIQDFEKIRILREEFSAKGETAKLKQLDRILESFDIPVLLTHPASQMLQKAKFEIEKLY